ncbi:MAG TPA: hypothetical protein ENJ37_10335 [Deltaproteobacteria bacterium]|nr:hypothetical protein [Deltaproteobacteria bacterium]
MGFRWALLAGRGESPFQCGRCGEDDRRKRNCGNRLGLSDEARCVGRYSAVVAEELERCGASKVFSMGGLRLYECPLSYITPETCDLMRMVFVMEATGALLLAGGVGDQPFWLVEALEIYGSEKARGAVGDER